MNRLGLSFTQFYHWLTSAWMGPDFDFDRGKTELAQMCAEGKHARDLLRQCLIPLEREANSLSNKEHLAARRALTKLYVAIRDLTLAPTYQKVHISLPSRGSFRATTMAPLREIGAPVASDRRHIIADFFVKGNVIPDLLNSLIDGDAQADYLTEVGCDPDLHSRSIPKAARKWQLDIFNHLDNLFMGPATENRTLGSRGIALDLTPHQRDLVMFMRKHLAGILGTWKRNNPAIADHIEQFVVQRLMRTRQK